MTRNDIDYDKEKFEKDEYGNLIPKITAENIPYPICPINMFFEGDEDKCNPANCDFDEFRSCSQACIRQIKKEGYTAEESYGKEE